MFFQVIFLNEVPFASRIRTVKKEMLVMEEVVARHRIASMKGVWTTWLTELLANIDAANFAERVLIDEEERGGSGVTDRDRAL